MLKCTLIWSHLHLFRYEYELFLELKLFSNLDANLFMRLDSAELLNWVQEQSEEKSPNLTKFTEHFNNMSYWTRTLILSQPDAKVIKEYIKHKMLVIYEH